MNTYFITFGRCFDFDGDRRFCFITVHLWTFCGIDTSGFSILGFTISHPPHPSNLFGSYLLHPNLFGLYFYPTYTHPAHIYPQESPEETVRMNKRCLSPQTSQRKVGLTSFVVQVVFLLVIIVADRLKDQQLWWLVH